MPSQKPKSFFLSAVGSATNGRPLVALTTHSNIPGNLRFSLPERQIVLVLAAHRAGRVLSLWPRVSRFLVHSPEAFPSASIY